MLVTKDVRNWDLDGRGHRDAGASRRDWPVVPNDPVGTAGPGAIISSLATKLAIAVWVVGLPIVIGTGLHAHGEFIHGLAICAGIAVAAVAVGKAAAWLGRGAHKQRR